MSDQIMGRSDSLGRPFASLFRVRFPQDTLHVEMNISSIEASKVGAGKADKRDKLAQTKLVRFFRDLKRARPQSSRVSPKPKQRERQLREAHKLDLQAKKTAKENSLAEQRQMLKDEVGLECGPTDGSHAHARSHTLTYAHTRSHTLTYAHIRSHTLTRSG